MISFKFKKLIYLLAAQGLNAAASAFPSSGRTPHPLTLPATGKTSGGESFLSARGSPRERGRCHSDGDGVSKASSDGDASTGRQETD